MNDMSTENVAVSERPWCILVEVEIESFDSCPGWSKPLMLIWRVESSSNRLVKRLLAQLRKTKLNHSNNCYHICCLLQVLDAILVIMANQCYD